MWQSSSSFLSNRRRASSNGVQPFKLALAVRAPGGARFLRVQVPNPPGSGKDIAEGKGAHREMGSEGSRMWGTY